MKNVLNTAALTLLVAGLSFSVMAQEPAKPAATPAPAKTTTAAPASTVTPAPATTPDAAKPAENPNAPEITFETEVHDYGTIKQGADGTCEFKFKNTGKEPLIISNAKGSCGCTVPTYPKEPIMKGQTAVIKVHYDTKRVGAFTKTVTIDSNAKTAQKVITIKGVVEPSEETTDQTMPVKKSSGMPLENAK